MSQAANRFDTIVEAIPGIGKDYLSSLILQNASDNLPFCQSTIAALPQLPAAKQASGIIISAGPSVHKKNAIRQILNAGYTGTVIAVDGTYVACLKEGLIPDFVLSLDPHPTRVVNWFGDPNFETTSQNDDYFSRQDLNLDFREHSLAQNQKRIQLVNQYGSQSKAIAAATIAKSVTARLQAAGLETYWWNPLMDDPHQAESLTRQLYQLNRLPCLNTGGTVGTAAWVFAHSTLKLEQIAVVGMDYSYYADLPLDKTQGFYELLHHLNDKDQIDNCFQEFRFPLTGEIFYTDPTYYWYRSNFLELLALANATLYNCTEGGILFGEGIECMYLKDFLTLR